MSSSRHIAIIGSGALTSALARILYDAGERNLTVYGIDRVELDDLAMGRNSRYFPKSVKLPKLATTSDMDVALRRATHVVLAVPSKTMDVVMINVLRHLTTPVLIINGSKGFYPESEWSLHEGIERACKGHKLVRGVVSLVGPSHAEEMVKRVLTAVTAVNTDPALCLEVQKLFANDYFRVYAQTDVKGAMACSAFKNVLAIASGMAAGLGGGINTTAALLTRGLVEMRKFALLEGGNEQTVMGLTGVGDLIVTATSNLSRNYTAGKIIATAGVAAIPPKMTVEGLEALRFVYAKALKAHLELPLVTFLHAVIVDRTKKPSDFKQELWDRALKSE